MVTTLRDGERSLAGGIERPSWRPAAGSSEGGTVVTVVRARATPAVTAAFDDFVNSRYASLTRSAYLLTGDWGTAEDVVQTALARTWLAWARLERHEEMDAYVRRVVVNVHVSSRRRRWWGETPTEELPDRPGGDEATHGIEMRDVLRRALAALPTKQRTIVVLRHYEQMSETEVASLLGISVGTVKSRCSRGLVALRTAGVAGIADVARPTGDAR
jgi:RNA polymerase sigma-70 factor (sigma-E family)